MKKLFLILLMALLLCGCSAREEAPEYVLTYAENQPANYPTTLGAKYFARLVEKRTGGRIVVDVRWDGQMGTQKEVVDQMAFGGIDFTRVSLSSLSDDLPILNVLQLPFLYEDADHMWRILDGPIGDEFMEVFAQAGLVGLSWYDSGARSFYATTPIRSASDLAGLTIRVQDSQMMEDMIGLLGATPSTLAYTDVYEAIQTGKVDGAENNWASYESQGHYLLAPYYTLDQHARVPEIQLVSAALWDKLSEEDRAIILECARESALYERKLWTQREEEARRDVLNAGTKVIALDEQALRELKALVQPLYQQHCGDYMDLIAQIQNG